MELWKKRKQGLMRAKTESTDIWSYLRMQRKTLSISLRCWGLSVSHAECPWPAAQWGNGFEIYRGLVKPNLSHIPHCVACWVGFSHFITCTVGIRTVVCLDSRIHKFLYMEACLGSLGRECPYTAENQLFHSILTMIQCKPYQTLQSPPGSILMGKDV